MITIGSQANHIILNSRKTGHLVDFDFMCTPNELHIVLNTLKNQDLNMTIITRTDDKCTVKHESGYYEFDIGHSNNSTEQLLKYCNNSEDGVLFSQKADINVLHVLKQSHKYLRNSPHFLKTMRDIQSLQAQGARITPALKPILELREKETYSYDHPVLDVDKKEFFSDDGIQYVYDHDTIHLAIAVGDEPAYRSYMKDGSEVMTDKDKFFAAPEKIRLYGVYEEACVLALERSQIPFANDPDKPTPAQSFVTALIKVCTSITSGWFREYAYNNFFEIINMYRNLGEDDYMKRFERNSSVLKPHVN